MQTKLFQPGQAISEVLNGGEKMDVSFSFSYTAELKKTHIKKNCYK